jgi:hypothetical protein
MLPLKYTVLLAAVLAVAFHVTSGEEKKSNKGSLYLFF